MSYIVDKCHIVDKCLISLKMSSFKRAIQRVSMMWDHNYIYYGITFMTVIEIVVFRFLFVNVWYKFTFVRNVGKWSFTGLGARKLHIR